MPYGGWGVMFQINVVLVQLGAEVCGGGGLSGHCGEGRQGEQSCCLDFSHLLSAMQRLLPVEVPASEVDSRSEVAVRLWLLSD